MVRAKFKCTEIKHVATQSPNDVLAMLTFIPVYGDGKDNKEWSKYTPSGKLEMTVTNPSAIDKFEIGKDYYLDFKPVEVWAEKAA